MTQLRDVFTTVSNGIPAEYTKLSSSSKIHLISKGQLNKVKIRPQIINESAESSREMMDTVNSSTILGQIFKASQDNINGIVLTLESAEGVSLDTFEGYANSGELQAVWILNGTNEALLETVIVKTGDKSMSLPLDTLNDEWQDTVGSTDYTGYTFGFDFYQTTIFGFGGGEVSFFIGDGANTKSLSLPIEVINTWEHFEINEAAMADDGGSPPDVTAITEIGFRVDRKKLGTNAYVDNLEATPAPGQVELKLWDMGNILPVGDGASFNLTDDATQYEELGDRGINGGIPASSIFLDLKGGKRLYSIPTFAAGPALEIPDNTLLTVNNYYAITIHYVDTDVDVYGPDTTFSRDLYTGGYGFSTTAENVDITVIPGAAGAGAYSDLMFGVFSTQDVWIVGFFQFINAVPGQGAETSIFTEDSSMSVVDISSQGSGAIDVIEADISIRPFFLEKGGKFEQYYNDDFTDSVAVINLTMAFTYIPPVVNG